MIDESGERTECARVITVLALNCERERDAPAARIAAATPTANPTVRIVARADDGSGAQASCYAALW
jgi:hypothetical protein